MRVPRSRSTRPECSSRPGRTVPRQPHSPRTLDWASVISPDGRLRRDSGQPQAATHPPSQAEIPTQSRGFVSSRLGAPRSLADLKSGGLRGRGVASRDSCQHLEMRVFELESPSGTARVYLRAVHSARAGLVLGHGAGGGVTAPDLVAASEAAAAERVSVALMEQPYRVAGRRSPPPARQLDAAWVAAVAHLGERELRGLPLVVGGRSLGARVACRTAAVTEAVGVLCLAFPLQPPRRSTTGPARSRLPELDAVAVPTLVVQGKRDPFGMPPAGSRRVVVEVAGDHSLKADPPAVSDAVQSWLADLLAGSL